MTCDRIRPLLSGYHDDVLSIEERALVRAHVAACPECGAVLAAYDAMFAALRNAATPVPADLRRNVYAQIAAIEARRGGLLPFGPALLGSLRTVGGTAGLLALLAALVTAVLRLNVVPQGGVPVVLSAAASNATAAADAALVRGVVGAHGPSSPAAIAALPTAALTAVAVVQRDVRAGAAVRVMRSKAGISPHTIAFEVVRKQPSGMPKEIVPGHLTVALASGTPVAGSVVLSTPTAVPTMQQGDGLAYLHLSSDAPFFGRGNAPYADVEWQAFVPGSTPRVLFAPSAPSEQMLTDLNASLNGDTIVFTAMSPRAQLSGVFAVTPWHPLPSQLLPLADRNLPNHGRDHRFVKAVNPLSDGRWLISMIDAMRASVVVTVTGGNLRIVTRIEQPTFNDVISPNGSHIAWTYRPMGGRFGTLQVANLGPGTQPYTRTIAPLAYHPIWSPDGSSVLYLAKAHASDYDGSAGLYLWSMRDGSTRQLVAGSPTGEPFISDAAWSPNGRFFAYVLTTSGARGTSQVWLGDTRTGMVWRSSITRRFIGAVAWVHSQPIAPRQPSAGVTATAQVTAASSAVATARPANATAAAQSTPALFDSTASPLDVLRSYYNALNRREYARAYGYLLGDDGRTLHQFMKGFADTRADTVLTLRQAPYLTLTKGHALTCVAFRLLAQHWDGSSADFGGYYMVAGASGRNTRFAGWRIVMGGTRVKPNRPAALPPQKRCAVLPAVTPAA